MIKKLTHPLWLHTPAIVALVVFVSATVAATPLPDNAPIHFGPDGQANVWGSPTAIALLVTGLGLLFIAISVVFSELWARQEQAKTFNPFSLLDDVFTGGMAAMGVEYLNLVASGGTQFGFPWQTVLLFSGIATAAAALLERVRPYRQHEHQVATTDAEGLRREAKEKLHAGRPLVYWESQDPSWMTLLLIVIPLIMFVGAAFSLGSAPLWPSLLLIAFGVLLLLFLGGLRTTVTRERIVVRFGTPGFRVLLLNTSDIVAVEAVSYTHLRAHET